MPNVLRDGERSDWEVLSSDVALQLIETEKEQRRKA